MAYTARENLKAKRANYTRLTEFAESILWHRTYMDPARTRLPKMAVPTVLRVSQGNAVEDLDFLVSGMGQY